MALFTFACADCGRRVDLFLRADRRNDAYSCGCGTGLLKRILTAPNLRGETVART